MTERESLEEIKARLTYFCAKTDGTFYPPWVKELIEIAEEGLKDNRPKEKMAKLKGEDPKHKARRKPKKMEIVYRAKSHGSNDWLTYAYVPIYAYGHIAESLIEASTMSKLASSIAYYYHRHAVDLYVSEDGGKRFKKADKKKQLKFSNVMESVFKLYEQLWPDAQMKCLKST